MKPSYSAEMLKRIVLLALVLISVNDSVAQYDTIHYIPPFYSRSMDLANLGDHYLYLSTNSAAPFDVTVTESDGTPIAVVNISVLTISPKDTG